MEIIEGEVVKNAKTKYYYWLPGGNTYIVLFLITYLTSALYSAHARKEYQILTEINMAGAFWKTGYEVNKSITQSIYYIWALRTMH